MSKKRMLADVLWEAANEWLHPVVYAGWADENAAGLCTYSCHAIQAAIDGRAPSYCHMLNDSVLSFLESLGCDGSGTCGKKLGPNQGARYMWLLLAMHVAEDEGIEV